MSNKFSLLTLAAAFCITMQAQQTTAPVRSVPFTVTQVDGTPLTLRPVGDEWGVCYVTTDNIVVLPNSRGFYCYARLKRNTWTPTRILAHNKDQRNSREMRWLLRLSTHNQKDK